MDDGELTKRINELVDEEHRLERAHVGQPLSDSESARRQAIEVELDRLWDLLRQRRARRSAGADPDAAQERPADVVEDYLS